MRPAKPSISRLLILVGLLAAFVILAPKKPCIPQDPVPAPSPDRT